MSDFPYFFHSTGEYWNYSIDTMIKIIETGGIKSRNQREEEIKGPHMFNGLDHISVCRYDLGDRDCSPAYSWFVQSTPFFIIDGDISAIKCGLYTGGGYDPSVDRVSQFPDEWHVRDIIPLDKIVGISLPIYELLKEDKEMLKKIKKILLYAKAYGWKLYDSLSKDVIEEIKEGQSLDISSFIKEM